MALSITKIKNLFISLKEVKNSIADNVEKLTTVFDNHNTNFEESDCVHNTVTKKILPKKFVNVFLNHDKEGEDCLKEFINDRIQSSISIWKPLKKTKLSKLMEMLHILRQKLTVRQLSSMKKEIFCQDWLSQLEVDQRLTYASILMTMIISENNKWLFYDNGDLVTTKDKYVILQDLTVI